MDDENFGGEPAMAASENDQDLDLDLGSLDDAAKALADDDDFGLTEEQPGPDEEDFEADGDALNADDETEDDPDLEEGDDVLVALTDGEQVAMGDLKQGYLRQKDYTHKTEELSREREEVESFRANVDESRQFLENAYQNLTNYLQGLVPPEPDLSLAQSDPGTYQYQQALRSNAIGELRKVLAAQTDVQADGGKASQGDLDRYKASQDRELVKAMPALKDPARRAAFDKKNKETAAQFGFSEAEIGATNDHRILRMVHYARLGQIAEQNRKNAGRRVAEKPTKGRTRTAPAAEKPGKSREGMKRLAQTGSIDDAVAALAD